MIKIEAAPGQLRHYLLARTAVPEHALPDV
jgi:hypothetical protein